MSVKPKLLPNLLVQFAGYLPRESMVVAARFPG